MNIKLLGFLLCFFLIGSLAVNGQSDKSKKKIELKDLAFYNAIYGNGDTNFDVVTAPEEWKDESFVFLGISSYLTVGSKGNRIRGINRKRVLLQDKNAVEKFAEFYYQNSETTVLNLIKKDGRKIQVDLKDAIKVATNVPSYYRGRFQSSESLKLAIANLEVGDILDYTSIFNDEYYSRVAYSDILSASVPILYQSLTFDIENRMDVYNNTYNTPVKIKCLKSKGHNYDGKPDAEMNRFDLEVLKLDAQKDEPWSNTFEFEPLVKFMAIPKSDKPFHSQNDIGLIKGNLNLNDLVKQFFRDSKVMDPGMKAYIDGIGSEVRRSVGEKSKAEIAKACYYFLRDNLMIYSYGPLNAVSSVKNWGKTYESIYNGGNSGFDEQFFLGSFAYLLNEFQINSEVVGIVPNFIGTPANALTFSEVYFGIYVVDAKTYFWPPNKDKTHFDFPAAILGGGKGFSINIKNVKSEIKCKEIEIAPCKSDENVENNELKIKIKSDNLVEVTKKTTTTGFLKNYVSGLIEEFGDNLYNDFLLMYEDDKSVNKQLVEYERNLNKNDKIYLDFLNKSDENLTNYVTKSIEAKDRKVTLDSFEIISTGRTFVNPAHIIQIEYKSDGILKKLGPNLIFEAGLLIDGQIQIEEKYKANREANINLGSPRIYKFTIDVTIPDTYTVEGLSNFNKSRENEFCSFNSTAIQEGNVIKISTVKNYKQQYSSKENWTAINEVLDEAYKFSQEKLVLKRK